MPKARKTMRHLKKKGRKPASKVGKSARRRTTKHQRRTRRRALKFCGGMNQGAPTSSTSPGSTQPAKKNQPAHGAINSESTPQTQSATAPSTAKKEPTATPPPPPTTPNNTNENNKDLVAQVNKLAKEVEDMKKTTSEMKFTCKKE